MKNREEYKKYLLEEAKKYSIYAMNSFYERLGYEPNDFKIIEEVPVYIGSTHSLNGSEGLAEYNPISDKIVVSESYIEEYISMIMENDNNRLERKIILNMAASIIHEKIHASRRIKTPLNIVSCLDEEKMNYVIPCDVILKGTTDVDNYKDLLEIKRNQDSLEESVTEALAQTMMYASFPKYKDFNIDDIIDIVLDDENSLTVAGAKIIKTMGLDMILWFITTRFNDKYENLFYETFGYNYDILLSDIGLIDEACQYDELIDKKIILEFDSILSKYKKSKIK